MAQGVAGTRIVFGAAFMLMPGLTGRVWIGRDAERRGVKLLTQAIGARDLTMGLGALIAMSQGKPARGWMEAISLTDAGDFVCGLLAKGRIPPAARAAVLVLAGSSAAQAAYAATGVDDD
jgi:hypothetical protein